MATIENGILGAFSGKCGNVIGYIRNGVACMRSMPSHYHDRRSALQLNNRNRFSLVMKMMSLVRPVISLGFSRFASTMTHMNVATQANYHSLVKEGPNGLHYDFSSLLLSRGSVESLDSLIVSTSGSSVSLLWNAQASPWGRSDKLSVALVNGSRMQLKFLRNVASRGDGTATISIPSHWSHDEVYCYLLVQRGADCSDSLYLGQIPVQSTGSKFVAVQSHALSLPDQSALKLLSDSHPSRSKTTPKSPFPPPDIGTC